MTKEDRLAKLERQVRFLFLLIVSGVLILSALLLCGAAKKPAKKDDTIRTHRLQILDERDKVRANISVYAPPPKEHPKSPIKVVHERKYKSEVYIRFYDEKGKTKAIFGINRDGAGHLWTAE